MRASLAFTRVTLALCLALVGCGFGLTPAPALAWSNGAKGDSFGTHDWVIDQAAMHARPAGYSWLDVALAEQHSSDPDFVIRDFYNHVYEVGSHKYGGSPSRVAALFTQTVQSLKAGNREAASISFGLLAHYYADTCQPLHTDQIPAEKKMHASYETAVDKVTDVPGVPVSWIRYAAVPATLDPRAFTVAAANAAHPDYFALVADYSSAGYDSRVAAISDRALARSASGVFVLEASIARAAGVAAKPAAGSAVAGSSGVTEPAAVATLVAAAASTPAPAAQVASAPQASATLTELANGGVTRGSPESRGFAALACGVWVAALVAAGFIAVTLRRRKKAREADGEPPG